VHPPPWVNGVYQPTFHDLLSGNMEKGVPAILSPSDAARASPDAIRGAILLAYERMQQLYPTDGINYLKQGEGINRFLLDMGVP
jgi:hypothetical protein